MFKLHATGREMFYAAGYKHMCYLNGEIVFYNQMEKTSITFNLDEIEVTKEDCKQNWECEFDKFEKRAIRRFKKNIGWNVWL